MLRRNDRTRRGKVGIFAFGAWLGAAASYFLDPVTGHRRRKLIADQAAAKSRRGWRRGRRAARGVAAQLYGVTQRVQQRQQERKEFDDVTLAHKVESEIFRHANVPKGQINVNAQQGIVQLRGEVPNSDMIDELVEKTRDVQGVREVENLLHLPGEQAPMHQ
jgi:osmotically-inducible protein OsmY